MCDVAVLWLTVARAADAGHATRDYVLYDDAGAVRGRARAYPWRRDIVVHLAPQLDRPDLVLRRRRSFALSGKVDVLDAATRRRIGVLSRSGRYRDHTGRAAGAFRDARTLGERATEGLFIGVMEALLGGDGSEVSGPSGFVHMIGAHPAGTLVRRKAPFLVREGNGPAARGGLLRRALPRRLGDALFEPPLPVAWRFATDLKHVPASEDVRLRMAAALFAVELSHW